jgi:phenylacetate-CoA ligase
MFKFHCANNPHYKNWIGDSVINDWKQIPVLTKSDLQIPLEQRFTKGYDKNNTFLNNTSGSSGTPFYFAKDKYAHAMTWAVVISRFSKHGVVFGSSLQARFYGIPISGLKYYKEKAKDFFGRRVRFPVFDLSDVKLTEFQKVFRKNKFYYVNGYTSSLVLFAKHLIKQGTTAKQLCPSLEVVFPTSEMCDDTDRKLLEQGFGVKVVNEYGASELDLIAIEDENGNWILNTETLLIEILNDKNEEVQPGEEGRVIVTSLYNKAMPFIRYELGDIAVKSAKKSGNYTVLEKVIGRTNDFALLPSGKQAAGLTFYYISKTLMDSGDTMKEFIIKQTKKDEFVFEYVADKALTSEQESNVQKALDEYLEPELTALFEKKEFIERTKAGKLKHFHNLID